MKLKLTSNAPLLQIARCSKRLLYPGKHVFNMFRVPDKTMVTNLIQNVVLTALTMVISVNSNNQTAHLQKTFRTPCNENVMQVVSQYNYNEIKH